MSLFKRLIISTLFFLGFLSSLIAAEAPIPSKFPTISELLPQELYIALVQEGPEGDILILEGNLSLQSVIQNFAIYSGKVRIWNELLFTSKELDPDTGLYYFNARWYDPSLGRFITQDPIRDGLNWYLYCSANPMTHIDPTGLLDPMSSGLNSFNPNFKVKAVIDPINSNCFQTKNERAIKTAFIHFPWSGNMNDTGASVKSTLESKGLSVNFHISNTGVYTFFASFTARTYGNGWDENYNASNGLTDLGKANTEDVGFGPDPNVGSISGETSPFITNNDRMTDKYAYGWSSEAYSSIVKIYAEIFYAAGIDEANQETMPGHSQWSKKGWGLVDPPPFRNAKVQEKLYSDINSWMQKRESGEVGLYDIFDTSTDENRKNAIFMVNEFGKLAEFNSNLAYANEVDSSLDVIDPARRSRGLSR